MKRNNKGFTLAELLIVVAIIAVLAAIAIPTFSTQLEKAREGVDLANVRTAYAEVKTAALGAPSGTFYKAVTGKQTTAKFDYVDVSELPDKLGTGTNKTNLDTLKTDVTIYVQCVAPDGTASIVTSEPTGEGVTKVS